MSRSTGCSSPSTLVSGKAQVTRVPFEGNRAQDRALKVVSGRQLNIAIRISPECSEWSCGKPRRGPARSPRSAEAERVSTRFT